jgi:hypothetical protein
VLLCFVARLGDGREQEARDGDHGHVELEKHQFVAGPGCGGEWPGALHGSPDRESGRERGDERRTSLVESKRSPDEEGEDSVLEWVLPQVPPRGASQSHPGNDDEARDLESGLGEPQRARAQLDGSRCRADTTRE